MPVTHGVTGSSPVHTAKSFVGTLTEWLGGGLQNRIQQFESAGYLHKVIHGNVNHFVEVPSRFELLYTVLQTAT